MEYTILKTISHHDMPTFQDMLHSFLSQLEKEGKTGVAVTPGVSAALIPGAGGLGVMTIASALIEYDATEEEWNTWRASEKFKIVKP